MSAAMLDYETRAWLCERGYVVTEQTRFERLPSPGNPPPRIPHLRLKGRSPLKAFKFQELYRAKEPGEADD